MVTETESKTQAADDKKLEKILRELPPDVQAEIIQIVRREPRIANILVNSPGRQDQIIHAVRAGREAGRAAGAPPLQRGPQGALKTAKKFLWGVMTFQFQKPKRITPYVDPANFPGVHPDFAALAQGAYYNAMGWGIEHHYLDHDHDHDHDHEHEAHHHRPHFVMEEPVEPEEDKRHHTHHAEDVRHEHELHETVGHSGH